MAIKIDSSRDDLAICHVSGEIDINSSPDIKKVLDKLISRKMPKMVVNLSKVTYVDSSGLATLVEILKNMKAYGGRMRLVGLSGKIKSLFEITKLDKLFEIISDEEEAISTFL